MKKIYCFINSGKETSCQNVQALSEDGKFLAGHISSNEGFAKHDIGVTSNRKHEIYKKEYPKGYELEWVDDPINHTGVMSAYEKHKKLPKNESVKNQPSIKVEIIK